MRPTFREFARIRWRSDWPRVENLPRSQSIGHSPQNASRPTRKQHHTKKIQWSNNLHVNVQWHWNGKERQRRFLCSYLKEDQRIWLKINDGHWAFLGPGEESKWYQGSAADCGGKWDLRASQLLENFENSGHPVFEGVNPLGRGILKKKNDRDTVNFNGENRPESGRKMSPEIQTKTRRSQVIGGFSRLPHASGNRMLQNLNNFNSMPLMSKTEYLRAMAKFYHPTEKRNCYVTTTLDDARWGKRTSMCKEYTAPRNREDSKPYASIDAEKEINWSSLKYWDCLQLLMLLVLQCKYHHWVHQDNPYGFWQVVVTKDLWMKFVVKTRTSWTQFLVARERRQPQWCVSRIFRTCRGKSRAWLTRFEQCQSESWTFKHASGNRCIHDTGSPGLLEK